MDEIKEQESQSKTPESSHEMVRMETTEFVEMLMPGVFLNESDSMELAGRTIEEIAQEVESGVFGIKTYKRAEGLLDIGGKFVRVKSDPYDESGTAYIDGRIYTLEEVKTRFPDSRTLISNMEGNGWEKVVKTRVGNWQPFREKDTIISSQPASTNPTP